MEYAAVGFAILFTIATSVPLGAYITRVFRGDRTFLDPVLVPVERVNEPPTKLPGWSRAKTGGSTRGRSLSLEQCYVACGVHHRVSLQQWLPLNPDRILNMEPTLAFNTVSSFTTNTDLQHYSGETGLSYFSQMMFGTFLQFVTAGTGIAACVAIFRALGGNRLVQVGNFYVDLTRASVRVLLPLALVVGVVLIWQGTPMTFAGSATATTVEGQTQVIARGVVAPMVAIKQLGTNGGGYFGPNSTHPFENPTPLSNFVEQWAILVIPMAMVWAFGNMIKRRRLSIVLFLTMLAMYLPMVVFSVHHELGGNPAITALGVDQRAGSMEGKEVRVGAALSALWAISTTATSNGSVNGMHDSLMPLTGLMAMIGMWLNNIFGGVGVGFINMLVYIIIAVFVAGMMIGRTPEFLGKKVEAKEMKLASLALLVHPLLILLGASVACYVWATTPDPSTALSWLKNSGPHGFSEMLYEFTSAAGNNGSGFEGLGDNTPFWNVSTGLAMLVGRYIPIIAPLALAGTIAARPAAPETAGSLRLDTVTFGFTLWAVVVILGLLMFMPVAVLGPVAEHLLIQ